MPAKSKPEKPASEILAPIPAEILDQIVRDGPLTAEENRNRLAALQEGARRIPTRSRQDRARHESSPRHQREDCLSPTTGRSRLRSRDREGTFEPQLIGKHERRFTGFDDKVIALYARGLTVREIQAFLKEAYAVEVPPDLISTVTDAIVAEVTAWREGPPRLVLPLHLVWPSRLVLPSCLPLCLLALGLPVLPYCPLALLPFKHIFGYDTQLQSIVVRLLFRAQTGADRA
jgi:hypothetical protein